MRIQPAREDLIELTQLNPFVPPHLVQDVVEASEAIRVRDEFGKSRLSQGKYTSGEIDVPAWRDDIEADFQAWKQANKK